MTQTASDSALSADGEQRRFASLDPRTGEVAGWITTVGRIVTSPTWGCSVFQRPERRSVNPHEGEPSTGEPDAGDPQVRFDERRRETEQGSRLRHRH